MSSRSPRPPPRRCRRRLPRPSCCCCCCRRSHLNEDTGRFVLLAALIGLYLVAGATVFSVLESPGEAEARARWGATLRNFSAAHGVAEPELRAFLRHYEAALAAGVRADALRPRWDFPGAFYFVGTVVSTIGFGMTTPATVGGKAFLIAYGLFGCAGTILFFNLFLERIISLLAFIMRACREHQLRRSGLLPATFRSGSALSEADCLAGWKPSVYHVLLILGLFAVLLSCCASAMYTSVEGWDYVDSLYFCFVTFSTIGFGDLVSSQHAVYRNQGLYRLGNFLFILLGVCCIYSLFNVISILIKQVLNWMLRKLSCRCCARCCPAPGAPLARRNAITPGSRLRRRLAALGVDPAAGGDSDAEGRRLSGELISMRDLTASNKVSLALLQKQLSETANGYPRSVCVNTRQNGFSGGVGALGIMNNRLAETSASR
ncbi:potassium channel subfamily K member 12 [Molossus nigricans]|uniref:Potassium two pore domain channel subfamily K member 12 n=1 Tax=Molossus molossus TaxID=27622 RepID=A0A7J8E1Y1_MOLMO|nr:potassium channel subfamily K member 12 [Molossus molossus]KAF6429517.1 potassium two pore domain channel subfamily K member 12 [Molossus molossus]